VPLNRNIDRELLEACRNYPGVSNARRITFEYVMLKGVNDSLEDAKALVRLLKGIRPRSISSRSTVAGSQYECSDWDRSKSSPRSCSTPLRLAGAHAAGDILAACGQLKSATEKLSARERLALRAIGDDRLNHVMVFHYTTSGLLGVLSSGTLFSSDYRYLTDAAKALVIRAHIMLF